MSTFSDGNNEDKVSDSNDAVKPDSVSESEQCELTKNLCSDNAVDSTVLKNSVDKDVSNMSQVSSSEYLPATSVNIESVDADGTVQTADSTSDVYVMEDGFYTYTDQTSGEKSYWDEGNQQWGPKPLVSDSDESAHTYIDKETNITYHWDTHQQEWQPECQDMDETERNANDSVWDKKFLTYRCSDPVSGGDLFWDQENSTWVSKEEILKNKGKRKHTSSEEEFDTDEEEEKEVRKKDPSTLGTYDEASGTYTYTDPNDGVKYEWDQEKGAYFPKVDEDFMAEYQMNYGFIDNTTPPEPEEKPADSDTAKTEKPLVKPVKKKPEWFDVDETENTKVYVSNLPLDLKEPEFVELMAKCGIMVKDPDSGKIKVKLYNDAEGNFKGDALCHYIKIESVELALQIIDGSTLRGKTIKVEKAKFTLKGEYDPKLKPKKKRKKEQERILKQQERLFAWVPEKLKGQRSKHEKCIVLKNIFSPEDMEKSPQLMLEVSEQLRDECSKCGTVKKVIVHDRHEDGVAQVFFPTPEEADCAVEFMKHRYFGSRRVLAETWDGQTKYTVSESKEQEKERVEAFEKFLEDD